MTAPTIIWMVLFLVVFAMAMAVRYVWLEEEKRVDEAEARVRMLETARGDARPTNQFEVPSQFEDWTPGDCEIWRSFLANPTGRKLVAICGQHALQQAMNECAGDKAVPVAAGMDAMLRYQFNFASNQMHQKLSEAAAESAAPHATAGEQSDAEAVEQRSF